MKKVSDRAKLLYLGVLILFLVAAGMFWLDYIGLIDIEKMLYKVYKREAVMVTAAKDDEPSLVAKEEFEKEKDKLKERVEDLDKREALISESEKKLEKEREKIDDMRKGIDLEKKRLEDEKKKFSGYQRNVKDLAQKITSIRPEEAVEIMVKWEEPLIVDVLRQIDSDAQEAGKMSISSYLISLMPRDKASRIMYLMTQL